MQPHKEPDTKSQKGAHPQAHPQARPQRPPQSQPQPQKQPHIQCQEGDIAPFVLLPGDPGRIDAVAGQLDESREVAYNREFRSITGTYRGLSVSAVSTGIGGPSTVIAVEELIRVGARVLIRIGSCGAMQPGMKVGDLVIAEAAVREDGAGRMYIPEGYPAAADPELVLALRRAAEEEGRTAKEQARTVHSGLVRSHDSFYTDEEEALMEYWSEHGILASDMETAPLYTVARLRGVRAASILNVVVPSDGDLEGGIDDLVTGDAAASAGEKAEIEVALRALYILQNS